LDEKLEFAAASDAAAAAKASAVGDLEMEAAELGDIPEAEYLDEIYDIIDAV
ncbi:hypothetical protein HK405_001871, partial [Cladochytrium tenue]